MKIVIDTRPLTNKAQTLAEFLQDIEDTGIDLATVNIEDENGNRFSIVKLVEEKTDGHSVDIVLCAAEA
jgi:hypothetical protein